ncbi:RHS repeat-associated protein [Pseudomonas sp. GGS8]|nr:RHS repeat-associated core domain-containing protein [Pseudomonas sp. GGS8]MCP1445037.1 RHS repeat-associated protein [Pseudomonas sp. GGS8]
MAMADTVGRRTLMEYDVLDRKTKVTDPLGNVTGFTYDTNSNLLSVTDAKNGVHAYTYDANSRRATLTLPNGVTVSYGYDNAGQLINLNYAKGGTSLGNLSYGYDNAGQRVQLGGSLARTTLPGAASSTSYNAANQLTAWSGASLLYDANGNMTSDGSNTYTWDSRQRLSTLTGAVSGSFSYDAANRRSQKTIAGQTTGYVFDGVNLVQELTGTVTPTVQANLLTGGVDEIFSRTEASGSTYSYLVDALSSTQALTDSTGALTTQYTYDPYGQTSSSGSTSANGQQYTGRENDGTGLYYYRARYYSPGFGRFISEDPISLAGGINTFVYVSGNPTNFIDPFGLELTPVQQAAVKLAAQDWSGSNVPYVWGGATKTGADCSGSISSIYKQADIDIGRMTSGQFSSSSLFEPANDELQLGDIGVYPGHVVLYGGDQTGASNRDVWSASHTGGPVFGPAKSSWYGAPYLVSLQRKLTDEHFKHQDLHNCNFVPIADIDCMGQITL